MPARSRLLSLLAFAPVLAGDLRLATPDMECIWSGGRMDARKLEIIIVGDGYAEAEIPAFQDHARTAAQTLLELEPFASYCNFFRVWVVNCISQEHGGHLDGLPGKNICFNAHEGGDKENIRIVREHVFRSRNLPVNEADSVVMVLENDVDTGGGSGIGSMAAHCNTGKDLRPHFPHELSHAFARLGDEYLSKGDKLYDREKYGEPSCPNITANRDAPKWEAWRGTPEKERFFHEGKWLEQLWGGSIDLFEGGSCEHGYFDKGMWRPGNECIMGRTDRSAFCQVCTEGVIRALYAHAEYVPEFGAEPSPNGDGWLAWVEVTIPEDDALVYWSIDGDWVDGPWSDYVFVMRDGDGGPTSDYRVRYLLNVPGSSNLPVQAFVEDTTDRIRMDLDGRRWFGKIVGPIWRPFEAK